ncbi:MAG: TRAP transporter large permease, partial [Bacillota bacterium]|jgi:C4-dicarboxylate transporter DctM subunit
LGILMSAANIAWLIPPSVCMIFYCLVSSVSVAELFLAGIGPGLILFLLFAIYEWVIAKQRKIPTLEKASWKERGVAIKQALIPLGFPLIILGGIYSGVFSPTEAAAVSVLYALIVEMFIYKTVKLKDVYKAALSTGAVTASVFILIAAGNMISWVLSFAGIPQAVMNTLMAGDPSAIMVLLLVSATFFVGCMFVDSLPLIMILTPIFFPVTTALGIDPIQLGIIIVILSALGTITPPFGVNLFTAMAIFNKSYVTVAKGIIPYIIIFAIMTLLCIFIPQVALSSWAIFY